MAHPFYRAHYLSPWLKAIMARATALVARVAGRPAVSYAAGRALLARPAALRRSEDRLRQRPRLRRGLRPLFPLWTRHPVPALPYRRVVPAQARKRPRHHARRCRGLSPGAPSRTPGSTGARGGDSGPPGQASRNRPSAREQGRGPDYRLGRAEASRLVLEGLPAARAALSQVRPLVAQIGQVERELSPDFGPEMARLVVVLQRLIGGK